MFINLASHNRCSLQIPFQFPNGKFSICTSSGTKRQTIFFWIFCRLFTTYGRTKYALTSLSCFYEMKSINKIVTTSINPEFESNVENVKIKLRKCMSKDTMSQMEQRDCYRRYHVEIDNLYIEYVTK